MSGRAAPLTRTQRTQQTKLGTLDRVATWKAWIDHEVFPHMVGLEHESCIVSRDHNILLLIAIDHDGRASPPVPSLVVADRAGANRHKCRRLR